MAAFKVLLDEDGLEDVYSKSPFNLKADLKGMSPDTVTDLRVEIANSQINGLGYRLFCGKKNKVICMKVRIADDYRNEGKSHGYRCITLVDTVNNLIFLLHLYRHGHGEDKNISRKDKNTINSLAIEYEESL